MSQYWEARISGTLANVAVDGAAKSVGKTGSHTTKTRTFALLKSLSRLSVAEAPRKQTAHVGESITSSRVEAAESLKAAFNSEMF